jgi:hypothetical protein
MSLIIQPASWINVPWLSMCHHPMPRCMISIPLTLIYGTVRPDLCPIAVPNHTAVLSLSAKVSVILHLAWELNRFIKRHVVLRDLNFLKGTLIMADQACGGWVFGATWPLKLIKHELLRVFNRGRRVRVWFETSVYRELSSVVLCPCRDDSSLF